MRCANVDDVRHWAAVQIRNRGTVQTYSYGVTVDVAGLGDGFHGLRLVGSGPVSAGLGQPVDKSARFVQ
jgi:hypothetical protein